MDNLTIHKDSGGKCFSCMKPISVRKIYTYPIGGLQEVRIEAFCVQCRSLKRRIHTAKVALADLEWKLFDRQN